MPKNSNYITIQGWMVNELKLKGSELLVYAMVYGFSQDGQSEFRGSISYVTEWFGIGRATAIRTLQSLTDKGLLAKRNVEIAKNLKVCYYSAVVPDGIDKNDTAGIKMTLGRYQNDTGGGIKMIPNNKDINNTKDINSVCAHPSVDEVRQYCQERGNNVDPERFVDYYTSNGWKVGRNPMKDWKAAVRSWERSSTEKKQPATKPKTTAFSNYEQRNIDYDALLRSGAL